MMIEKWVPALTVVALTGTGLMAGLFLAFSVAVMPGLRRMPAPAAILSMQSFNSAILNPVFGLVFGGTTLLCVLLAVAVPFSNGSGNAWHLVGALVHVAGGVIVTMVANVPMNNRLDELDPAAAGSAAFWADYLSRWTAWNHLRAVASTAATVLLAIGLMR